MADQSVSVGSVAYEETTKEVPDQTQFASIEISQGSFDDDDGLEMVPVTVMGAWGTQSNDIEDDDERPSNERLLLTAFVTFMSFTLFQTVAAYIAGSEAMMGDSAAMFIDALTYLFNLVAERRKSRFEEYYQQVQCVETDPVRRKRLKQRAKRKMILKMELIPPVVSVTTLVFVTAFVLKGSIGMILLDAHRDRTEQGDPNVNMMLIFSCANLLLDMLNVFCFARAKRLFGYETSAKHVVPGSTHEPKSPRPPQNYAQLGDDSEDAYVPDLNALVPPDPDQPNGIFEKRAESPEEAGVEEFQDEIADSSEHDWTSVSTIATSNGNGLAANGRQANGINGDHAEDEDDEDMGIRQEANLNMCSAYTVRLVVAYGNCENDRYTLVLTLLRCSSSP
jgi:hypothetical protein